MPRTLVASLVAVLAGLFVFAGASDAASTHRANHAAAAAATHRANTALRTMRSRARRARGGGRGSVSRPADSMPAPAVTVPQAGTPAGQLGSFASVRARDTGSFSFTLSRPALAAGRVQLQFQNDGQDPHDLTVAPSGGGGSLGTTGLVDPGHNATLPIDLAVGRYQLYCSLPTHAQSGMRATLDVR